MNASGALNACKSSDEVSFGRYISGRRVSNTWVTYPPDGDNGWKHTLKPDELLGSQPRGKTPVLGEGPGAHQLVGEVTAHQGKDG